MKKSMAYKRWRTVEDELVLAAFQKVGPKPIADALGRSEEAVLQRASDLGVRRRFRKAWTDEDDALLADIFSIMPLSEVARIMGRTGCACQKRASDLRKLGDKRFPKLNGYSRRNNSLGKRNDFKRAIARAKA